MTVSVLQVNTGAVPGSNGNTIVCNTIVASAGSYLHVIFAHGSGATVSMSSVSSSPSLTWTILDDVNDTTNNQRVSHASSSVTAADTYTVTGTLSGTASFRAGIVKEIGGSSGYDSAADASAAQFQSAPTTAADATTSGNTPSITSQPALISGASLDTSGSGIPSAGTGFTNDGTSFDYGGGAQLRMESKRITATGAQAATFTATANFEHVTLAAVFLESSTQSNAPRAMHQRQIY